MFGLSFMEIVVLGALALIVIGPKQLPEMARVLGRLIVEFKKATTDLSGGLLEIKNELREPLQEGLDVIERIKQDAANQVNYIRDDIQKHVKQVTEPYAQAEAQDKKEISNEASSEVISGTKSDS